MSSTESNGFISRSTRKLNVAPSAAFVVVAAAVGVAALSAMDLREPIDHGISHAIAAAASAAFFVLAIKYWLPPAPGALSRGTRLILAAGFGVFALGQALETAGAIWFDALHGLAQYPAILGVLLTILGGLSSIVIAAAARLNLLDSRWMPVALVVPVAGVVLFVVGAFVFGY